MVHASNRIQVGSLLLTISMAGPIGCNLGQVGAYEREAGGVAATGGSGNSGADGRGEGGAGGPSGTGGTAGTSGVSKGAGLGESCSDKIVCREGLDCKNGGCIATGSAAEGEGCLIAAECKNGQCVLGRCVPAGEGDIDASCETDASCSVGLRCGLSDLSGSCQVSGTRDVGGACETNAECHAGLYCTDALCSPPTPTSFGGTSWAGVDCAEVDNEAKVRAYFEVPGAASADELDFFRLPFPNDARMTKGGRLKLKGFPTPGTTVLGYDPVARYLDALTKDAEGWGTSPAVTFRFSGGINLESLKEEGRLQWVDVTPNAAEYGQGRGWQWFFTGGRSSYVCENRLLVKQGLGGVLKPGHVYAVFLTTGLVDEAGRPVEASKNLASVLGDAVPDDPALAAVHAAYKPFRDYLDSEGIGPDQILNATVITVGEVRSPMAELAKAAQAAEIPTATQWVRCDGKSVSPCPEREEALGRACGAGSEDYEEFHALVKLPVFQEGEPPYLTAGGRLAAEVVRRESVCLSLTVPKGTMPESGWPAVVFAHGTGGSFRSHVRDDVAGALARAELPDGTKVPMAVLGIDQVVHGSRRGGAKTDPESLFFNFQNPDASRGNPLQGAVDQLSLARFAESLEVTVGDIKIRLDPDGLAFFGHSQGATEGSLMLPYSTRYKAAVLSGNGASLRDSLLTKSSPVNILSVLPIVLKDAELNAEVGAYHPVLGLLQHWIDPADPYNFAAMIANEPLESAGGHSLFMPYGLGDTYSAPSTMQAYAIAAGMDDVENSNVPKPDRFGLATVTAPLQGNRASVTLGLRQYVPSDERDGHFVVFDDQTANSDMVRFLAQAVHGEVPSIGE